MKLDRNFKFDVDYDDSRHAGIITVGEGGLEFMPEYPVSLVDLKSVVKIIEELNTKFK